MHTPQINIGYGTKITINWDNPTNIIKEKIFYDTSSDHHFPSSAKTGHSDISVNQGDATDGMKIASWNQSMRYAVA